MSLYVGLDVGSISADLVVVTDQGEVLSTRYERLLGRPLPVALALLEEALQQHADVQGLCVTGTGAKLIAGLLQVPFVNEIVAQSRAAAHLHPQARTIIEIGGEDSKLICLGKGPDGKSRVEDFAMNTMCAAGTGSFLDQQASRLERHHRGVRPTGPAQREPAPRRRPLQRLRQERHDPPAAAGPRRTTTSSPASASPWPATSRATWAAASEFARPIAFQGGVAANPGMVRAFRDVLDLDEDELIIPEHFACHGRHRRGPARARPGAAELLAGGPRAASRDLRAASRTPRPSAWRRSSGRTTTRSWSRRRTALPPGDEKVDAYLGIDVGSISTNVVVIDATATCWPRRYLMTAGRPLEAVTKGLRRGRRRRSATASTIRGAAPPARAAT